ncbi:hypothetical protein C7U88_11165 [Bradyrhizobium sp. WBOS2]|nr:hypothetical protein [Bradyrhizobium sp. WBOS2]
MHLIADAADVEDDEILAVGIDQALELADHIDSSTAAGTSLSSWPGSSRPSTALASARKIVDARDKPGHDGGDI